MGKDFLKLKTDTKKLQILILTAGILISSGMGVKSYMDACLQKEYEVQRTEAGEGDCAQELRAYIEGEEPISLKFPVNERRLTEAEAEKNFQKAVPILKDLLKGENDSLEKVTYDLNFADEIPEMPIEVIWNSVPFEYFDSGGALREDVEIAEPVEVMISAILSCQEYCKDFQVKVKLLPRKKTAEEELLYRIQKNNDETPGEPSVQLPREYQGKTIVWKKPVNTDFLIFFILTIGATVFIRIGEQRDKQLKKKERSEHLEKEYAQIVSKFTMLLSAGLSIRNAWERIVIMEQRKKGPSKEVYEEMKEALHEMQKGIPELEVYEKFAEKTGQIHYKKLMAAFISYKRRGGNRLLEVMNQEMLDVWEDKKRRSRQQGEMIGTKLLLPMMGMLAVVFMMILVPAFLSFQL